MAEKAAPTPHEALQFELYNALFHTHGDGSADSCSENDDDYYDDDDFTPSYERSSASTNEHVYNSANGQTIGMSRIFVT